ncbi:glutamic acid-rich protein-like [Acanthaster planci]|uniref:Glutamic acid-rich protein-like n=1 Tax=Acanthaster planci TaxID=133434 RepID=A0A8B7ZYR1_ACAPL|nr:glutamic acid-rich protein-like [Acanthaster planci]
MSMKGITPGHTEGECSPGHTEGECSQQVTKSRTPFSQIQNTKNENLPEEFFIAECTQKANGKHRDEHCVQNDDAGSNNGNEEGKMEAACSENLLEKDVSQRKTPKAKKRKSRRLRINLEESDGDEEARVSMCQARNQYIDNVNLEIEAVSSDEEEGEEADDLPLEREKSDTENIDRGASSSVKRLNRNSMNKHNPETKRCTDSSFRSGHASPEHIERLESGLKQRGIISQGQKLETTSDQICLTKVEDLGWTAGRCSCGKEGLRYLFHIKNMLTKKETYVGSRCILLFKLCKEIAETVKMLLCNGITGTLIDKDNLKFLIQKNTGLVKHSKEMKKLGSLPLHQDSKRGWEILTVRAEEGIGSKVLEMKEGLVYKIRLQLTFKEDTDGFGLWQAEMIDFVSVPKGMMQSTHSDADNGGTEKKETKKHSKGSQWDFDGEESDEEFDGEESDEDFDGEESDEDFDGEESDEDFDGEESDEDFDGEESDEDFDGEDSDMDADSEDSDMDANSEEYGTDADSDGSDMGGDSQESDWYVDRGHRTRTGGPKRRNCQESDTDESAEESDSVDLEDANPSLHQSNQCKSRNTSRDKRQTRSGSQSSQNDACGRKRKMGKESKNKKRKRQKTSNKREIKVELELMTEDSTPVNWIVVTSPASTSASHQEIVRVKIEDTKIENGNRSTVRKVAHVSLEAKKSRKDQ